MHSLTRKTQRRESLAIIQYVIDKYDAEHKISSVGENKYLELQWLAFQISGQGFVYPRLPDPKTDDVRKLYTDRTSARPRGSRNSTPRRFPARSSGTTTRLNACLACWSRPSPSALQATSSKIRRPLQIWHSSRGTRAQRPGWRSKA